MVKTNKTKVINNIEAWGDNEHVKELKDIKRRLRQYTNKDIESIEYMYRKLVKLYHDSCIKLIDTSIEYMIKKAIKSIYESDIIINSYEGDKVKDWLKLGIY